MSEPTAAAAPASSAARMRLAVDCRYVRTDRHDGISRYTAELVTALARLHPVTMLISDGRQLRLLPDLPWRMLSAPTSPREPLVALEANRLDIEGGAPDVIVSPMQTMGSIGRRYGLVLTIHDLIYYENRTPPRQFAWPIRLLWRAYHLSFAPQRILLGGADAVAVISETTAGLMRRHRLTSKPMPLVPNAPDPSFAAEPRSTPPAGAPNLVYMGSFMPYKNVETVAAALRELPGWTLHLCSKADEATLRRLEALAPAGSIIAHQGVSDDVYRELLAGATALVTASRNEGFGLPVIEAMSAGVPVLCSDIPIFREVAEDAAIRFDPDSPAELARAARTLEDPAEWARRSAAGVERARAYSWDASARSLLEACERVHAERLAHG